MKRMLFVLAVLIFGAVAAMPTVAQDNPFVGTWKMNSAKSKAEGMTLPKSMTRTVTADGKMVKYATEGVTVDGTAFGYSFSSSYDGKASAVTGTGMPSGADSVTLKRVSANKVEATLAKGGKELGKSEAEVAKDGKSTTLKSKGKGADGKEWSSAIVYDKQ
jgi:hypothetical protein